MLAVLQIATVSLVAVAMGLALAHALELPAKMCLDRNTYLAVQTIYYPGFTIGGMSEPIGVILTLVLLISTPTSGVEFWWVLAALLSLVAMQLVFWLMTQPANRYWLQNQRMTGASAKFFAIEVEERPFRAALKSK